MSGWRRAELKIWAELAISQRNFSDSFPCLFSYSVAMQNSIEKKAAVSHTNTGSFRYRQVSVFVPPHKFASQWPSWQETWPIEKELDHHSVIGYRNCNPGALEDGSTNPKLTQTIRTVPSTHPSTHFVMSCSLRNRHNGVAKEFYTTGHLGCNRGSLVSSSL